MELAIGLQLATAHAIAIPLSLLVGAYTVYALYRWLLPRPFPGIPFNQDASRSILGDIPDVIGDPAVKGDFSGWTLKQIQKLRSPLIQIFIRPFGKPILVLADFRESQDVMMRRTREFDRSFMEGEMFSGIVPNHHIHRKSDSVWKSHRKLLQDLMTQTFLHNVAAPAIHASALNLTRLWNTKAEIAHERSFSASEDIYHGALDAVLAFSFGENSLYSAVKPQLDLLHKLTTEDISLATDTSQTPEDPVLFPQAAFNDVIQATLDLAASVETTMATPTPRLAWAFLKWTTKVRKAMNTRDSFIRLEVGKAVRRLQDDGLDDSKIRSAVDHIVERENRFATKEGRTPNFFSNEIFDEVFGFVVAGHDTTSTTLLWGLKYLTDNPSCTSRLRLDLQAAYSTARSEGRSPSVEEIIRVSIPYLDATIEEILRCATTIAMVAREATADTELLGHRIPKGTTVIIAGNGPSILSPAMAVDETSRSNSARLAKAEGRSRAWDEQEIGVFDPERWLTTPGKDYQKGGNNEGAFDATAGPHIAFGLGTRGCFGRRLAYLELRIILVLLIWNFELLPCAQRLSGYEAVEGITRKPKNCYVKLRKVAN
ncbi:hypothetical protein BFJ66_g17437 [Fusarium oxysporum f. sp. cepae]|uniref:Cytochrome P450 monooxygenase TRI13 n=1 Tax=Fusarium oxysporum f. sp. cepae TaxID=396571 RepID=A0A3L6N0D8_FUSOX|nr:hypothetical protein BFJ65_g14723 [Fusarium oxysporum f. sp. cepae]RKK21310.1 hypothetical protein BFJ67_g17343 [Fusarium oxysporum f. sp. cepae]RKK23612.1 hypothetical protein BFJ66_g17437 [Fusarium oxysporum f. sp. cepae]